MPVWVLLQGQAGQRKILPKSKQRIYVGYEDSPQAIQYYNAKIRKILTSHNYRFLIPPTESPLLDAIVVAPNVQCKGEPRDGALPQSDAPIMDGQLRELLADDALLTGGQSSKPQPLGDKSSDSQKRKRKMDEGENSRKMHGIKQDYRKLNDPFSESEDEDLFHTALAEALIGGSDPKSLNKAKDSSEWPKWESVIKRELEQLCEKGTWRLVDPPKDTIPLKNKWVFTKKYGRDGDLLKYKGRLVVKGFAQQPGFDYIETYSLVIRMETLRAILAISAIRRFVMRQMDVKGAYLNGTLKERVYMHQPDGYEDGTERLCLLVKTLYGLKQSG